LSPMELGIAVASGAEAHRVVKRAEDLGVGHAWFYDSQLLYGELFASMAAAAMRTERIRLGSGVLIPSNRIAPIAANGFATLARLAPGRIDFGVGTGFTGRRSIGADAIPLAEMKEHIRVMRELWAGGTPEWDFEGTRRKIRFLNPETSRLHLADPIPLYVSAFGPKTRAYTAEVADGWMNFLFADEAAAQDARDIRERCSAGDRDPDSLHSVAFTLGCVLDEGEPADSPRAVAQAGPLVAAMLHNWAEAEERGSALQLPPEWREVIEAYAHHHKRFEPADARYLENHTGHLMFVREGDRPFITGEMIRALTFTGTPDELRGRAKRLADAGYHQIAVQLVPDAEDAIDRWVELFRGL
ncbi:MAG: LLM class flavin-dependent oxidoreductase, partial [Myxococcales bacterium]|nr:LLM class flavin-dependent oxidoreductase [Myxococcales bacterium]